MSFVDFGLIVQIKIFQIGPIIVILFGNVVMVWELPALPWDLGKQLRSKHPRLQHNVPVATEMTLIKLKEEVGRDGKNTQEDESGQSGFIDF